MVRLVGVHKRFGTQRVLRGVDLELPRGKTTVILGPSGCGKSVTLKLIVGLLRPDAGEVWVDGERVDQLPEREFARVRLKVGLLFQMGALFDSLSVAENIEFPLIEHTTLTRAERVARIARALATVDLAGIQGKLPAQLSGGQRKRVALARAIVLEPRVILFDEPTTGLDPIRSDGIDQLVRKLQGSMGVTNLVVTHDLTSARKVADHAIMLIGGRVAARGSFADLQASPDHAVRQFLEGHYEHDDATSPTLPAEAAGVVPPRLAPASPPPAREGV